MILHCVFLRLRPVTTEAQVAMRLAALSDLCDRLDGAASFDHGPNRDFEDKTGDFSYGFVIRFRDADALRLYADHPEHRRVGAALVEMCEGDADGIRVYDLEA